ncbi:MAG TPA: hypothetical protein VGS62_10105 [Streptosporangiaceae bacterium]|nr:hypothetical protein [Streptosporangiaceae bacterium]
MADEELRQQTGDDGPPRSIVATGDDSATERARTTGPDATPGPDATMGPEETPGPEETLGPDATADRRVRTVLADLFAAPAEPASRAGLARWASPLVQVAVVALGALVMLARVSGRPAWDSIYAEDPRIYLPQALAHPWHLLQSYGGYLQLVPRLIGQIAALLPIRHASVAFAAGGALVASACGLFAYHASAGQVRSRWLRALVGLSVVLLPVAPLEIADNGVNSIWYLLVALFWAALWRPRTRTGAAVAAVVAFAAAASSSLALVFVLLFAARAIVVPRRLREHAATAGWVLGSLLQAGVIATSHLSRFAPRDPVNLALYYAHDVLLPALGWHLSWHLRDLLGLTGATALAGGVIVVILASVLATQDRQCRVFVVTAVLTGLVLTTISSALAWGGPGQRVTPRIEHGARYSTVPILLLDAALIVAADAYTRRWWRRPRPRPRAIAAVVALVAVLAAGWVTDFRYPVRRLAGPPSDWQRTAAAWLHYCQHQPAGTITVTFRDWWSTRRLATTFSCSSLRR